MSSPLVLHQTAWSGDAEPYNDPMGSFHGKRELAGIRFLGARRRELSDDDSVRAKVAVLPDSHDLPVL